MTLNYRQVTIFAVTLSLICRGIQVQVHQLPPNVGMYARVHQKFVSEIVTMDLNEWLFSDLVVLVDVVKILVGKYSQE